MSDKDSQLFIHALVQGNRQHLALIPKSDLHNHSLLGSRRSKLEIHLGTSIQAPPARMASIGDMDQYLFTVLAPLILSHEGFSYCVKAAFQQAVEDGVTVLEMSFDSGFNRAFEGGAPELITLIQGIKDEVAPGLLFIPQLGMNRDGDMETLMEDVTQCIGTGYFKALDLYGEELSRSPESFIELYREASKAGLRLMAHVGEFGDAESVRHTVDVLGLQEVQHGIAAATSPEIMHWLRDQNIRLNVCPSSNVALGRAQSLSTHPIRLLYDHGVKVSLNTDDLMIFDQSICDEYFNLYDCRLFSAEELDDIRLQGLESLKII